MDNRARMNNRYLRIAGGHGRTRVSRAELRDCAVLEVDEIEERRG